jgi:DNA-binding NarL/FixJ family response regulator
VDDRVDVAPDPVRIVPADDHPMVRRGLRILLEAQPDVRVVGEAGAVDTALRETIAQRPTVVVLDVNMPGEASLPAMRAVPRGGAGHVVHRDVKAANVLLAERAGREHAFRTDFGVS